MNQGFLGEMADSRAGVGNIQDTPRTPYHAEKQVWAQIMMGNMYQNETEASLKGLPPVESGAI